MSTSRPDSRADLTAAAAAKNRPLVLCVDDEPDVLEAISLHLGRPFRLLTAPGGAEGLALMEREPEVEVVVSDMRMPKMSGAEFLRRARELRPATVRLLLTGQADLDSAINAVNEGQIFRFLTKPCPPKSLVAAVQAAVDQHRLLTAERVLLEQTLLGSVKALSDVLAVSSPAVFGRAGRIKKWAVDLAEVLAMRDRWRIEVAAMLSQLGAVALPPDLAERLSSGAETNDADQKILERAAVLTDKILANIPRLEEVRAMLHAVAKPRHPTNAPDEKHIELGTEILRVANDLDLLEQQGNSAARSASTLHGRAGRYDPQVIEALQRLIGANQAEEIRELPITSLKTGMVLASDMQLANGTLLVARGYQVTDSFLERLRNFSAQAVKEPIRVLLRAGG